MAKNYQTLSKQLMIFFEAQTNKMIQTICYKQQYFIMRTFVLGSNEALYKCQLQNKNIKFISPNMNNNSIFSVKNALVFGLILAGTSAANLGINQTKGTAFHVQAKIIGGNLSGSTHSSIQQDVHSSIQKKATVKSQRNRFASKGKKAQTYNSNDEESNYNEKDSSANQHDQENRGVYEVESNPHWGDKSTLFEQPIKMETKKHNYRKYKKPSEKPHDSEDKKCQKPEEKKFQKPDGKKCEKSDDKKSEKHHDKKCKKSEKKKCQKHEEKECEKPEEKKCEKPEQKKCQKHEEKKCQKHEQKKCQKHEEKKCEKHEEKKCEKHEEKNCDQKKKCCDTNFLLFPVQAGQKKQCVNRAYLDCNNCCVQVDGYCKCWQKNGVCKECYVGYKVDCKDSKKCVLA